MSRGGDDLAGGNLIGRWIIIAIVVIVLPCLLMTDFALEKMQGVVNENAKETWAGKLQRAIALGYSCKFQHAKAAERYEYASRFYATTDPNMWGWMKYNEAVEIESGVTNGKWAALPMFEALAEQHPHTDFGAKASTQVTRIKTYGRP